MRETAQWLCEKGLLTWATEVELLLEVDVAHEFFLGKFFAGCDESVDLGSLVSQKIGDGDLAGVGRGEDLDASRIS